jgi:hypothetical protein
VVTVIDASAESRNGLDLNAVGAGAAKAKQPLVLCHNLVELVGTLGSGNSTEPQSQQTRREAVQEICGGVIGATSTV